MRLETARLVLRPWEDSDAPELFALASDPRVGPPAGWPPHASVEESREVIAHVLSASETYALCLREGGCLVGSIGLKEPSLGQVEPGPGELEVGYWVGVPFWGQGLAPEAVRALIRHAFDGLGCVGLWCGWYHGNEKSQRVQEKCGFEPRHTSHGMPVPLFGERRTCHFSYLSRERWEHMA